MTLGTRALAGTSWEAQLWRSHRGSLFTLHSRTEGDWGVSVGLVSLALTSLLFLSFIILNLLQV